MTIHKATHPVAGNLFHLLYAVVSRYDLREVLQDGLGNRVVRFRFEGDDVLCHLFLPAVGRFHLLHLEDPFGEGARFVDDYRLCLGDDVNVIGPFEQNTVSGRSTDAAKITQRDGDDEGTWAGDNQEHQCPVEPVGKNIIRNKEEGDHRDGQRKSKDNGGIDPGERAYEKLRLRLAGGGFLHHLQHTSQGTVSICFIYANFYHVIEIYHACKHSFAFVDGAGNALAGKRGGVEASLWR